MIRIFLIVAMSSAFGGVSDLYYHLAPSDTKSTELRLLLGHDFSDPYLVHNSAGIGVHWLINDTFGIGAEVVSFSSDKRQSSVVLEKELGPFGPSSRSCWAALSMAAL